MSKYIWWKDASKYTFHETLTGALKEKEEFGGQIYECLKLNILNQQEKDEVFEQLGA